MVFKCEFEISSQRSIFDFGAVCLKNVLIRLFGDVDKLKLLRSSSGLIALSPLWLGFCTTQFKFGFGAAVLLDFRLRSFWCAVSAVRQIVKYSSFWWEIEQRLTHASSEIKLPFEADYVIVGAGYTGLSAALTISRQGHSVLVVDSGVPGFAASTRNGGICSGQIRPSHTALSAKNGNDYADAVYAEGIEARLDLANFCAEERIECDLQMTGRFTGAMSPKDYETQCREADRLNKIHGHKAFMIPRSEQQSEIKTDLFFGGMVREEIGGFHPGKFFAGLLKAAQAAGAVIHAHTCVEEIIGTSSSKKTVVTNRGSVLGGKVIIATNAYTGTKYKFGKFLRRRLVPAQSCIIVTEALGTETVKDLMPKLRMYGNTAKLYSYFRPTPARDRILLGSRSFDRHTPSARSVAYLKQKLTQIFPELSSCSIAYCWLGNVAFTQAQIPTLFENDGIFYAAGYAGSGTVWARWLGKKIADTAMGTGNQPSIFWGPPPPRIPLYDGNPWFLPVVNRYFSFKDWIKRR